MHEPDETQWPSRGIAAPLSLHVWSSPGVQLGVVHTQYFLVLSQKAPLPAQMASLMQGSGSFPRLQTSKVAASVVLASGSNRRSELA
jgi:hypothetical protein